MSYTRQRPRMGEIRNATIGPKCNTTPATENQEIRCRLVPMAEADGPEVRARLIRAVRILLDHRPEQKQVA